MTSAPKRTGRLCGPDHENRAGRITEHALGDRADQDLFEQSAAAVTADDDEIGAFGGGGGDDAGFGTYGFDDDSLGGDPRLVSMVRSRSTAAVASARRTSLWFGSMTDTMVTGSPHSAARRPANAPAPSEWDEPSVARRMRCFGNCPSRGTTMTLQGARPHTLTVASPTIIRANPAHRAAP